MPGNAAPAPTWRLLLAIEELAFAESGFQARHPDAARHGFAFLADSHLAGPDLDAPVGRQRDDDPLPAVYAIVRALVQHWIADTYNQDYLFFPKLPAGTSLGRRCGCSTGWQLARCPTAERRR
jgi:hypothetical protein